MNKEELKKQYENDKEYAINHPTKGVQCTTCINSYFHPILGCKDCGKYKELFTK